MTIKNIQKIKCEECGKSFPNLATHINRTHKLTVAEYKRQHKNASTMTDEFREKLSVSAKNRFIEDPSLRKKVSSRTFDFIKNKPLSQLLQRDYKSAKICLQNSLWKPSIVLYASIIEAVLKEKHPEKMSFRDIIEISYSKNDISEKQYHQISMVRDLRNYVHLHKELSEESEINDYWAKTFAEICESIIKKFT
jgi:hypothetical protein